MAKRRHRPPTEPPAGLPQDAAVPAEEPSRKQAEEENSMADEDKTSKAASTEAPESGAQPTALATETPVPAQPVPETSQYVVTVNNQTGLPVKVEKLEESGERKELTPEEYAALVAYCSAGSPSAGMSVAAYSTAVAPLVQGYLQGYADVVNALTSKK